MKMRQISILALAAGIVAASPGASALPFVFNLTGTFANGALLSGTLTIDTTTGLATGVNAIVGPPTSLTFTVVDTQTQIIGPPPSYQVQAGLTSSASPDLIFTFPVASLVGYVGGNICSGSNFSGCTAVTAIDLNGEDFIVLQTGSVVQAVPEPATLALLGLGLAGLAFARRRQQ